MTTKTIEVNEAQIHELLEHWTNAVNNKDIDAVMDCYTDDVVAFDMVPPLQCVGKEAYRKNWEMGFDMCEGDGTFETHDQHITICGDAAFCHRLNHMSGTGKDGEAFDCWVRWTVCFRKVDGRWLIAHEHISAPMDMETEKVLMNLEP
jgi:uncharacterized protein (TIGR02246 family)